MAQLSAERLVSGEDDKRDGDPPVGGAPPPVKPGERRARERALDTSARAISESSLADSINLDLWSDHGAPGEPEPGAPEGPLKIGDSDEAHHATSEALARFLADRYDSELPSSLFPRGVDRTSPLAPSRPELDAPQRFDGALARVQSGAVSAVHREPSLLTVPLDADDLDGMLSTPAWDDDDWGDHPAPSLPQGVPNPFGPGELTIPIKVGGSTGPAPAQARVRETSSPPRAEGQDLVGEPRDQAEHLGAAAETSIPVASLRPAVEIPTPLRRDPDAPQSGRRGASALTPGGFGRGLTQPYAIGRQSGTALDAATDPDGTTSHGIAAERRVSTDLTGVPPDEDAPVAPPSDAFALPEVSDTTTVDDPPSALRPMTTVVAPRSRWRTGLSLGLVGAAAAVGAMLWMGRSESPQDRSPVSRAQTTPVLFDEPRVDPVAPPASPSTVVSPKAGVAAATPPPVAAGPPVATEFMATDAASLVGTGSEAGVAADSGDTLDTDDVERLDPLPLPFADAPLDMPPPPEAAASAALTGVEHIVGLCQERDGVEARRLFRALRGSEPRKAVLHGCTEYGIDLNADSAGPTAAEYLAMAQEAYAAGDIGRAYLLARNSSREERSTDALMLMGKAACDLREPDKVDHVHGMLMPRDQRKLQRYCLRNGVRLR